VVPEADAWTLYANTRDRLIALVRPLTTGETEAVVPITPGWSIADVVAHVCGLNADIAAGMREGLGTDERTAHQVETRAGDNVATVCDEWMGHGPAMQAAIGENEFLGRRLAADLVVHLHDLQHALDQPIDRDDEATVSGGRTYAARTPDRLVELTSVVVAIELTDGSRFEPGPVDDAASSPAPVDLTLRATPYDFLRSVTGRRSRREVLELQWSGDPAPILDVFSPYGPLRTSDAGF
jgi:hypothetical protein